MIEKMIATLEAVILIAGFLRLFVAFVGHFRSSLVGSDSSAR